MSSAAVVAEGIHSGVDLLAAVFAFWAVRQARRPADADHAYGHGKYDALSGAAEGLLIFGAAFLVIVEAVRKILAPEPLAHLDWGIAVVAASAGLNLVVSEKLLRVAKRTRSLAVEADGHHLRTDVWTSTGVLVGLLLIRFTGYTILDAVAAFVVAALIVKTAWSITRKSLGELLDKTLPLDEERRITEIIRNGHPHWRNFHNLRTRRSGNQRHVDLHIVTCREMPVQTAHDLTEDLEDDINREFPLTEVVTHVEACEVDPQDCNDDCPLFPFKRTRAGRPEDPEK